MDLLRLTGSYKVHTIQGGQTGIGRKECKYVGQLLQRSVTQDFVCLKT